MYSGRAPGIKNFRTVAVSSVKTILKSVIERGGMRKLVFYMNLARFLSKRDEKHMR